MPRCDPSGATGRWRHREWAEAGVRRVVPDEPAEAGKPDPPELAPDASLVEAKGGRAIGPTECGKGTTLGIGVERRSGVPPAVPAGTPGAVPVPPVAPAPLRDGLEAQEFRPVARHRKGRERPSRSGGRRLRRYDRRFVAERASARVRSFRRADARFECRRLYDASAAAARAFIALSKL